MARLLIVSFSVVPAPDRHGVQLANVFKALAPRVQVDAIAIRGGDQGFVERFMRTRLLRVPVGSGGLRDQIEAFRRAVRRQLEPADYDVIHFRSAWAGLPVCERKAELGAKLVFEVALSPEGEPRAADPDLEAALRDAEAFCFDRADLVLVPTQYAAAEMARRGERSERVRAHVAVVPTGVDVDLFDWEPAPSPRVPRVVYVGRLAAGRGVRLLMRAMRRVLERRDAALQLVGPIEPGFVEPFEREMADLSLEGHIERVGPVEHEDVPRLLGLAAVAVAPHVPDETERPFAATPSKILEYMAARRPVVAPRRPVVTEVLHDGEEGLLFSPGDHEDLASKILRVLDEPGTAGRIAENAYRTVRARHTAAAARRALLDAYERLIGPMPESEVRRVELPLPVAGLPTDPETTTGRGKPAPGTETRRVGVVPPPPEDTTSRLPFSREDTAARRRRERATPPPS